MEDTSHGRRILYISTLFEIYPQCHIQIKLGRGTEGKNNDFGVIFNLPENNLIHDTTTPCGFLLV